MDDPTFVHVTFEYPEPLETPASRTILTEKLSNEAPRFQSKLTFSFPSNKSLITNDRSDPQLSENYDNFQRTSANCVANASHSKGIAAEEAEPVWDNNKPRTEIREASLLANAIGVTALRAQFLEVLKFLKCEGLVSDSIISNRPISAKAVIVLKKETAEFYFMGQKEPGDFPRKNGGLSDGSSQFPDVERLKGSLSRSYAGQGPARHSQQDGSLPSQTMQPVQDSIRNLLLLKFATKYTDYNVSTQWLSVLLKHPFGKKMDLLNGYIDSHGLRDTFEQYLETHLMHDTSILSPYWLIECNSEYLDYRMHKLLRMAWKPRAYRNRKAIWHKALDSLDKEADCLKAGYDIHACPALLDMNMAESATSNPVALRQRWAGKSPLILALISEASLYLKNKATATGGNCSDALQKDISGALQRLIELPFPTDDLTAAGYAGAVVNLADAFYRFWMESVYDESASRHTLRDAASNTEKAHEPSESDQADEGTQTSVTLLPVEPTPVLDVPLPVPTLKRAHSSAVSKVNRIYCLSCLENTPNLVRIAGDNRIMLSGGMVVDVPEPSSGCPLNWNIQSTSAETVPHKELAHGPDFLAEFPSVPPISRRAPLNDRFQHSGWLLPDEQTAHTVNVASSKGTTVRENRTCDEDSPDAPADGCPIAFKVLDIQDSGELLVLEDKGSAANVATSSAADMAIDYSAVMTHPLYETVRTPADPIPFHPIVDYSLLLQPSSRSANENDESGLNPFCSKESGRIIEPYYPKSAFPLAKDILPEPAMQQQLAEAMSDASMDFHDAVSSHEVNRTVLPECSSSCRYVPL